MLKKLCVFLCLLLLNPYVAYAKNEPYISAASAIVIDAYSGEILFEKNAYEMRAVASTTKIMTCLIACEKGNLGDTVKITPEMLEGCDGSSIYLESGDEISLYDLVCGAMIASGNDAANAIAFHISGTVKSFADLMNEKARTIGMKSTQFVTPSGLDKGGNHSTAYDMALLSEYALENSELKDIAAMKSKDISINGKNETIIIIISFLAMIPPLSVLKQAIPKKQGAALSAHINMMKI